MTTDKIDSRFPIKIRYEDGKPSCENNKKHIFRLEIKPVGKSFHVYTTIEGLRTNPIPYIDGMPCWHPELKENKSKNQSNSEDLAYAYWVQKNRQPFPEDQPHMLEVISLGCEYLPGQYLPVVRFGLANDGRAMDRANITLWLNDGKTDYYGPYARPDTLYEFKIEIDFERKYIKAWTCCRGDEDWFMLVEKAQIPPTFDRINIVNVEQYPGSPDVEELLLSDKRNEAKELLRIYPADRVDRGLASGEGFRLQSMRSAWRKPGKQVTVFRRFDEHAAFPDIVQIESAHFLCIWRDGSHSGGRGGIYMSHSIDGGIKWFEPVMVTGLKINCPRLQRLKDGTLLLIGDIGSGNQQYTSRWDVVIWESKDGGYTWINERWLKTEAVGGNAIVPGRITELSDGSWLLCASSFFKPEYEDCVDPNLSGYIEKLEFYKSMDRGYSWKYIASPCTYPPYSLSEPSIIQLPDGRLLVYGRESRVDGMTGVKGYSCDGGLSWKFYDFPFPIVGRTCAGILRDGRVFMTFRSDIGRAALWAWIGEPDDMTSSQPFGIHYNDENSVGLKNGELHILNEGINGQFTMYGLRPADSRDSIVELEFEVMVLKNDGKAATVSIPFGGMVRMFPDHIEMVHDDSLGAMILPSQFHKYRIKSKVDELKIYIDEKLVIDTNKGDSRCYPSTYYSWYGIAFGNEPNGLSVNGVEIPCQWTLIHPSNITREVTGYSVWKEFNALIKDPVAGTRNISWSAEKGGFPDQYQLDHIIEVDASVNGRDQGYSGWVQLEDDSVLVVNYTDDTSPACIQNPFRFGVPWIRGTFLNSEDLI